MNAESVQVLSVGDLSPSRMGPGWWTWLAQHDIRAASIDHFPDGEIRVRLPQVEDNVEVYCDFRSSTNGQFEMQQIFHVCAVGRAAKQQGARSIRLVTPELPCMRQDRPIHSSDSIELGARDLILDMLSTAGFQEVCTSYLKFDVASSVLRLRFPTERAIADWFVASGRFRHGSVVALDHGGAGLAAAMAEAAGVPTLMLEKLRSDDGIRHIALSEETRGILSALGPVLVVDDLLVSGQSLLSATAEIARSGTVDSVDAFVWHIRPTASGFERVEDFLKSDIVNSIMTSNLVPDLPPGVTAISADLLLTDILDRD